MKASSTQCLAAAYTAWALATVVWFTCCLAGPSALAANALAASFVITLLVGSGVIQRRERLRRRPAPTVVRSPARQS